MPQDVGWGGVTGAVGSPKHPRGLTAGLPLSLSDSASLSLCFHLYLFFPLSPCPLPCCLSLHLSPPIHLSLSRPCPHPTPSRLSHPWAGPSAGQGSGDDRLLPLAAARRGLRVAAIRGHGGWEREEPRGASCALGQPRAQVRAVPTPSCRGLGALLSLLTSSEGASERASRMGQALCR